HFRLPSPRNMVPTEGYVMNVYVEPAWRRRGIASALMGAALDHARALGLGRVRLHATDDGRQTYARAGFLPREDGMELNLAPLRSWSGSRSGSSDLLSMVRKFSRLARVVSGRWAAAGVTPPGSPGWSGMPTCRVHTSCGSEPIVNTSVVTSGHASVASIPVSAHTSRVTVPAGKSKYSVGRLAVHDFIVSV